MADSLSLVGAMPVAESRFVGWNASCRLSRSVSRPNRVFKVGIHQRKEDALPREGGADGADEYPSLVFPANYEAADHDAISDFDFATRGNIHQERIPRCQIINFHQCLTRLIRSVVYHGRVTPGSKSSRIAASRSLEGAS